MRSTTAAARSLGASFPSVFNTVEKAGDGELDLRVFVCFTIDHELCASSVNSSDVPAQLRVYLVVAASVVPAAHPRAEVSSAPLQTCEIECPQTPGIKKLSRFAWMDALLAGGFSQSLNKLSQF